MNENEIKVNEETTEKTEQKEEQNPQLGVGSGIALGIFLTVAVIAAVKKVPGAVAKFKSKKKGRSQTPADDQGNEACDVEVVDEKM